MGNANSSDEEAEPEVVVTPSKSTKHRQSLDYEPKPSANKNKKQNDSDTESDNSDDAIDITPGKLAARGSLRASTQENPTNAKKPSKKPNRNGRKPHEPKNPPGSVQLSNLPNSSVLPPPDYPPDEYSSSMDEDSEFTELAELLTAFRLGKYMAKFTSKGVSSVRQLSMCSENFLAQKIQMGLHDIRLVRAAIASVDPTAPPAPPPIQETKEEQRVVEQPKYELISESDNGKSRKLGATELSACQVYSQSWGCAPHLKCCQWMARNRKEVLAGFTTALTVIPTALAFSFLGSMNSTEGLMGTWIIMLVLAIAGGCPGMVYCNAGAVAVVLVDLAEDEGPEYVFYAFMLSGIVTAILGYFKVARLLRLLPASVMVGFVNGLAIVIFFAQLKNFQKPEDHDDDEHDDDARRLNSFEVLEHNPTWISGEELIYTLLNIAMTMIAMYAVPYTCKQIPGALAGMTISLVVEWGLVRPLFHSKTSTVGDVAKVEPGIPMPVWMNNDYDMPPINMHTFNTILPTALTISAVGLIESLMTVRFVSAKNKIYANSDVEAIMLGVGNIVAGAFGGQGGCSEIGLTVINLNSGGCNRTSSFTAAICTLLIMYAAADGINAVPIGGLVGIMFVVVTHIFDFGSFKTVSASLLPKKWREYLRLGHRHKINRVDAVIIVAVTVITPFFDLAIAVAVGCLIAMCGFTWEAADRLAVEVKTYPDSKKQEDKKVYVVTGQIYYASIDKFISCFDVEGDPPIVEIELHAGDLCDYSALQAINGLGDEYKKVGKSLRLRKMRLKSIKMMDKGQGLLHAFGAKTNDLRDSLHGQNALHTDEFDEDVYEVAEAGGQEHLGIESYGSKN